MIIGKMIQDMREMKRNRKFSDQGNSNLSLSHSNLYSPCMQLIVEMERKSKKNIMHNDERQIREDHRRMEKRRI